MTDCLVARARVLATDDDGRISLRLLGREACPGCRCGRLTGLGPRTLGPLRAPEGMRLTRGAEVTVSMPARAVLRGAVLLHGLPWAAFVLGAGAAALTGFGDLGCLAGGVLGLGGALLYIRRADCGTAAASAPDVRLAPRP